MRDIAKRNRAGDTKKVTKILPIMKREMNLRSPVVRDLATVPELAPTLKGALKTAF